MRVQDCVDEDGGESVHGDPKESLIFKLLDSPYKEQRKGGRSNWEESS